MADIKVINNLVSTSATDALSANMGRVLNNNHLDLTDRVFITEQQLLSIDSDLVVIQGRLDVVEDNINLNDEDIKYLYEILEQLEDGTIVINPIAVIDNLESTDPDAALSANQGRVLNEKLNVQESNANSLEINVDDNVTEISNQEGRITALEDKIIVTPVTVIDNLTSTSTTDALSANQGKTLNEISSGIRNNVDTNINSIEDQGFRISNLEAREPQLTPIVDNITSTSTTDGLSANQGRVLRETQIQQDLAIISNSDRIDAIEAGTAGIQPGMTILRGGDSPEGFIKLDTDVLIDSASNPVNASIYGEQVNLTFSVDIKNIQPTSSSFATSSMALNEYFSLIPITNLAGGYMAILDNSTDQYIIPDWPASFRVDEIISIFDGGFIYYDYNQNNIYLVTFDSLESDINLFINSFNFVGSVNLDNVSGVPTDTTFHLLIFSSNNNENIVFLGENRYCVISVKISDFFTIGFNESIFTYHDLNNIDGLLYGNSYTINASVTNQNYIINNKNNLILYGFGNGKTSIQEIDFINKQVINTYNFTEIMNDDRTYISYSENIYLIQNNRSSNLCKVINLDKNLSESLSRRGSTVYFYSEKYNSQFYIYRSAPDENPGDPITNVFFDGQNRPMSDFSSETLSMAGTYQTYSNRLSFMNQWRFKYNNYLYMLTDNPVKYTKLSLEAVNTGMVLVKAVDKISEDKVSHLKLG